MPYFTEILGVITSLIISIVLKFKDSLKPKVLFLYTEIAEYFIACASELANQAEVHIVRWPLNSEAPFQFSNLDKLHLYSRKDFDHPQLIELAEQINPDIIICSGWVDKGYLEVCKRFKGAIPTLISMDNHWKGTLKQWVARLAFPFTIGKLFSHAWVPGAPQRNYALKLSFKPQEILTGFYSADMKLMDKLREDNLKQKKNTIPKRFLYLGRYVPQKGLTILWDAFKQYRQEGGQWELWCAGTGDLWDTRLEMEGLRHLGFVQPQEFNQILGETSVYILPSNIEPWGVSVQEMAACGMPMILSDKIGSKDAFLEEGKNGFSFRHDQVAELKALMHKFDSMGNEEWQEMSQHGIQLAQKITPQSWAQNLLTLVNSN
ncbi:glycosyltransferase [bacterium SCSIO 12741]|nr:glycosyltransferase [bacterium SCSIO 12741]